MGHKKVCLNCRLILNREFDKEESRLTYPCPECRNEMILLPHRFRPPKKGDDKKWQVVKYLLNNGFHYQHISKALEPGEEKFAEYPETLSEAKEFVKKFKNQAIKK